MLKKLLCAILGMISINPFLRPAPPKTVKVSTTIRMKSMELKIKRLACTAKAPTKAHPTDAAFDLYADVGANIYPNTTVKVSTGIAVEIPEGYYAQILGRSGLASKGVHVTGGVIDCGYRGEWQVILHCTNKNGYEFKAGDKIAQFVLHEVPQARIVEVDELSETARGEKGFGSSGA